MQLVRKQNVLLSSPEQLLPPAYYVELQQKYSRNNDDMMYGQLLMYTDRLLTNRYHFRETSEKIMIMNFQQITLFLWQRKQPVKTGGGKC